MPGLNKRQGPGWFEFTDLRSRSRFLRRAFIYDWLLDLILYINFFIWALDVTAIRGLSATLEMDDPDITVAT